MPIYEFECPVHGKFSRHFAIGFYDALKANGTLCEQTYMESRGKAYCMQQADMVWSLPANVQIGKPTIVFTNPQTGEARIAVHEHEQAPAGFVKQELKSSIERTAFEHQQSAKAAEEDAIYNEMIVQKREDARRQIIDNAKAHASDDASTSDNPSATRSLMDAAINHVRNKPTQKRKRKTEFRFDVNHLDKSNL